MTLFNDVDLYLPKFLSIDEREKLFENLKDFPNNIDSRFYTNQLENENNVFQGDGLIDMPIIDLPNPNLYTSKAIILSNTCDIDTGNKRFFNTHLIYAPIININKYEELLLDNGVDAKRIKAHLETIKKQQLTQILFLPSNSKVEDSIVFLDRINSCSNDYILREKLSERRLFTLSNYGFYLFLLKLSISFTRIADGVNRL